MKNLKEMVRKAAEQALTDPQTKFYYLIKRKNNRYYAFLHYLTSLTKPKTVVELGTSRGVSALHLKSGYPQAKVYTIDNNGQPEKDILSENGILWIDGDSVESADLIKGKIDILYIDSLHTGAQKAKELNAYLPKMKQNSIIVMDDIHLNEGMTKAWSEIAKVAYRFELNLLHEHPGFGVAIINKRTWK